MAKLDYVTCKNIRQTLQAFQSLPAVPSLSKKAFCGYGNKPLHALHYYLLRFVHFVIGCANHFTKKDVAFKERSITADNFLTQLATVNKVKDVIQAYFAKLEQDEILDNIQDIKTTGGEFSNISYKEINDAQTELGKILEGVDGTQFATFKKLLQGLKGISVWLYWNRKLGMPIPLGSIKRFLNGEEAASEKLIQWCQKLKDVNDLDIYKFYHFLNLVLEKLGKDEKEIKQLAVLISEQAPSVLELSSSKYTQELGKKFGDINKGHNSVESDGGTLTFNSQNPFIIFTTSPKKSCEFFPRVTAEDYQLGVVTIGKVAGNPIEDEKELLAFLQEEQRKDRWFNGLTREMIFQDGEKRIKFTCARTLTQFTLEPVSDFVFSAFKDPAFTLKQLGFNLSYSRAKEYLDILGELKKPSKDPLLENFRKNANLLFENIDPLLKENYTSEDTLVPITFLRTWMNEKVCYHRVPTQEEFVTFIAEKLSLKRKDIASIKLEDSESRKVFTERVATLGVFRSQAEDLYLELTSVVT